MSQPQRHYTLDDDVAVEETSAIRHERFNGEIFADTATDPVLLVAVLSEATRDYDRGAAHRIIPSLREAVLVDQGVVSVEHWQRESEPSWSSCTVTDLGASLALAAIPVEQPLREIYREVFG